ncbi:porin [Steroidobacter sp. S1-65]|uniref:Porin n=1 Tax=Steroidobacter gossypii TaxID=2805490 RepID=A0ABS1WXF5_9GAMM|nr:porin [Steroidobacter gossypii]MBM0105661.1 porin [Steroidobacter gossypii]
MKKHAPLAPIVALVLAAATPSESAETLELYMDMQTKQLYAEPGPNRVRLGRFRSIDESAPEATAQAPAETPPRPEALEQRLERSEAKLAELEKHNDDESRSPFTDRFEIRGYLQTRYTEMLGGDDGINLWSDRSVGDQNSLGDADKNYLIRRARLVFQGDVGDRLSFYIQPDLASSAGTTGNVVQMRDAYGDVYLTTDRVHRLRVGQSKVPFGWENLQSSSNRLALDRADAINSGVRDERDLGVFYYFTPEQVQERFSEINKLGLKHSGNYGMFGLGLYNGQGANRGDRNDNQHVVARLNYPWQLSNGQFFEAGIQAYSGEYVPSTAAYRAVGDVSLTPTIASEFRRGYEDERVGVSAIWYPQPFGLQAEWNWGTTPALDLASNSIVEKSLNGGYVQAMYKFDHSFGTFLPFVKWQYFDGANKAENNAPINEVNDLEIGVEWQIAAPLELAAIYHRMKRNNLVTGNRAGRIDYERFDAEALRLQLQMNF